MKKKIFIILLTVVVSLTSVEAAQANDSSMIIKSGVSLHQKEDDSISEYVTKWFEVNGYGNHNLSDPLELYSLGKEKVAVMYSVDHTGYVIVNLINYDIMEFAFDYCPAKHFESKIIYNGFLELYEEKNNKILRDGSTISSKELVDFWSDKDALVHVDLSDRMKSLIELDSDLDLPKRTQTRNGYFENGSLSHSLVTWSSNYYCQIDAAAIVLRYLHDYIDVGFLPSSYLNNGYVQYYLCNNHILTNCPLDGDQVVYGSFSLDMTGLNNYISTADLYGYHYAYASHYYNFYQIKGLIEGDKPVVLELPPYFLGQQQNEFHAVIAHGYMIGYDGSSFLYINNGNGNNGISINAYSSYHDDTQFWYID